MLEQNKAAAQSAQSVRYLNELRALDVLFPDCAMSRADLARALGLNRSTTGNIVNDLLTKSLVVERPGEREDGPRARIDQKNGAVGTACGRGIGRGRNGTICHRSATRGRIGLLHPFPEGRIDRVGEDGIGAGRVKNDPENVSARKTAGK